jgi:hypothetical protein
MGAGNYTCPPAYSCGKAMRTSSTRIAAASTLQAGAPLEEQRSDGVGTALENEGLAHR